MQMNLRMRLKELFDRRALVRREIVRDHMDLFAARLIDRDVSEKGNKLREGVSLCGPAQHFASLRIEGDIQRQRAMPVVLKALSFGASRREQQQRIFAIKGLTVTGLVARRLQNPLRSPCRSCGKRSIR